MGRVICLFNWDLNILGVNLNILLNRLPTRKHVCLPMSPSRNPAVNSQIMAVEFGGNVARNCQGGSGQGKKPAFSIGGQIYKQPSLFIAFENMPPTPNVKTYPLARCPSQKPVFSSSFVHIPSFSRRPERRTHRRAVSEPITVSLLPAQRGTTLTQNNSFDSVSSWSSSASTSAPSSLAAGKLKKIRAYPSACIGFVVNGASAIFPKKSDGKGKQLEDEGLSGEDVTTTPAHGLRRIFSRRHSPPNRPRRNSLVLPEVPMTEEPYDPGAEAGRPSQCTLRDNPPPMEDRSVRFSLPPSKAVDPRWQEDGPAWCDFMATLVHLNIIAEEDGTGICGAEALHRCVPLDKIPN
ncbi:hypothetical protein C8R43DRAFT_1101292 [Mycena crocata]|nr:hypothetical protein C8R43DRAFT_1101292 [Mycena crocata]